MDDYYDPERCHKCGGLCCKKYNYGEKYEQTKPTFLKGYVKISRIYNAHRAWVSGTEYSRTLYRNRLSILGIDATMCPYWDRSTGCIIPREDRPPACRQYICEEWSKTLINATIN